MARSLISTLVGLLPESARRKAMRARRAKSVMPNHRAELNYLGDLLVIVEQCRRAGAEVAAGLRVHWDEFLPATDARPFDGAALTRAVDLLEVIVAEQRRRATDTATAVPPGLDTLLAQAARRFGGIELVAHRLAKLATQRTLGAVDETLIENIHRAIGVDISSYLGADTEIGKAMAAAAKANVELIKSIPSQYLDEIRETAVKAFAAGERWETVAKKISHVDEMTETRAKLIARDQTSKMNASFNEVRQTFVGIEEYTWSGALDKRERPSHVAMEGSVQKWNAPPSVDGENVHPGQAVNCFPGDSEIQFAHDVKKAYRRRYSGELAEVVTDSGKSLRGTPNHPVLTPRGWLALGQLNEGDYVIEVSQEVIEAAEEHRHDGVPSIAQVFAAASSGHGPQSIHLRVDDFHGDGSDGDVDVVFSARPLVIDYVTADGQRGGEFSFAMAVNRRGRQGVVTKVFFAALGAASRIMRGACEFLSGLWRQATHPQQLCFANAPSVDAGFSQAKLNHVAVDVESPRDGQFAFAGHVGVNHGGDVDRRPVGRMAPGATVGLHAHGAQPLRQSILADADDLGGHAERLPFGHQASRVVKARRFDWSGHVFNLETAAGWYVTNGIVTHNCRCAAIPRINLSATAESEAA